MNKQIQSIRDYENRSLGFVRKKLNRELKDGFNAEEKHTEQEENDAMERPSIYKN